MEFAYVATQENTTVGGSASPWHWFHSAPLKSVGLQPLQEQCCTLMKCLDIFDWWICTLYMGSHMWLCRNRSRFPSLQCVVLLLAPRNIRLLSLTLTSISVLGPFLNHWRLEERCSTQWVAVYIKSSFPPSEEYVQNSGTLEGKQECVWFQKIRCIFSFQFRHILDLPAVFNLDITGASSHRDEA